jgi:hypothetical protein
MRMQQGARCRYALGQVDHQNEGAEVTLHDPRKTRGRSIPRSELTRQPLACSSRVLGAVPQRHPEAAPKQGKRRANLGRTEAGVFLTS